MLASLTVRDVVLIERADLGFAPGLNVLTGETGAGKSILLDALGLAAGERGQGRTVIRPEAEQASVIAVFEIGPTHPVRALLTASALDHSGPDLILRRMVSADGRSRAFVNDQPVGMQCARELGEALVEVHGQADDRHLFDVNTHRALLDAFGGHAALAEKTRSAFQAVESARQRLEHLKQARDQAAQERDYLRHAADELAKLAPEPGEEERLAGTRALLMNGGRLAQDISTAVEFLSGDGGAEIRLTSALRRLSRLQPEARAAAQGAETALDAALAQAQEGRGQLDALLARLNVEPEKLEQIEDRLFGLRAAARKYGVASDGLRDLKNSFEAKLAALDGSGASIAAVEEEWKHVRAAYLGDAAALSAARREAAKRLETAVTAELPPLKLGAVRFRVALSPIDPAEAGANGLEKVGFEIASLEKAAFGPIAKIASGGELARFALALKVVLAQASPPAVLVFDEVDRGVGGAVAAAVGERLQRLARTTQVLLVTHSPQVAARATRHFRITRVGDATKVVELEAGERVEEIARMLSGAAVTEEARAAAKRLLAEAETPVSPPKKRAKA